MVRREGLYQSVLMMADPADYSFISLLAGTEVYVSPEALERLKAAENPDKVDLYLSTFDYISQCSHKWLIS